MKSYEELQCEKVPFDRVLTGKPFGFNGSDWIKKSSRTAHIKGRPNKWFYFSKSDVCETVFYH